MGKGFYINDLKRTMSAKKDPVETFNIILSFFNFDDMEIKVYNLLLNASLTIKEIQGRLDVSERSIRKYIKRLEEEGLITKSVDQGDRLRYVYRSVQVQDAWKRLKASISKIIGEIDVVLESSLGPSSRGASRR